MRYARLLACLLLVFLLAAVGSQLLRRVLPGDRFNHPAITRAVSGAAGVAGAGSALTATERSGGSTTSTTRGKSAGTGATQGAKSSPSTAKGGAGRSATSSGAAAGASPSHFRTLPPGVSLPSGSQCAAWVRARPLPERKAVNRPFNRATGHRVGSGRWHTDAADQYVAKVKDYLARRVWESADFQEM